MREKWNKYRWRHREYRQAGFTNHVPHRSSRGNVGNWVNVKWKCARADLQASVCLLVCTNSLSLSCALLFSPFASSSFQRVLPRWVQQIEAFFFLDEKIVEKKNDKTEMKRIIPAAE